MKKILIFTIIISTYCKIANAQIDTNSYLRDTIYANKSFFIGKQLSVLLDTLKIEVKVDIPGVPKHNGRDSSFIDCLYLYFKPISGDYLVFNNMNSGITLNIVFDTPFSIANYYFDNRSLLGSWYWNAYKRQFYGKYIIRNIIIEGR